MDRLITKKWNALLTLLLLASAGAPLLSQTKAVINANLHGSVIDEKTKEPVLGASLQIKGTTHGVVTDENGTFYFQTGQKLPFTVIINSLGYQNKEVTIEKDESIITLEQNPAVLDEFVVTSRRRAESAQNVPIPLSVVSGAFVQQSGSFNVTRVKEYIPSLQMYTSNPRNTGINIRGLGSPFGLTNDGLDPGVGFYVDGVYYARPAAATLDFIDIDRIEVLRGPQGTLFGKNTTAGAINITSRKASFTPIADFEISYGNYGFIQAKTSITGPLSKKIAGRLSFSGTQRGGVIQNIATGRPTNELNNLGFHGQLLYEPSNKIAITLAGDASRQRPDGYAQVIAGVVETKRSAYRQFNSIISSLKYSLPSLNAFDRKIDHDTPWRSGNDLGGISLNGDFKIGSGTLTSTSAWRYWKWDPSNDRDFTGLQALAKSQNPAEHANFSQEIRYAGDLFSKLTGTIGLFYFDQNIKIHGSEISGKDQWRFVQSSTSPLWSTPGLFEGFGAKTEASIKSKSAAIFANLDWEILKGIHFSPGVRFNYDQKDAVYNRIASGGLDTANYKGSTSDKIALQGFKNGVYVNQAYIKGAHENNLTYNLSLSYKPTERINGYVTYSTSFKPIGVNVAGLPVIDNKVALDLATIKPEYVQHFEAGIKSTPLKAMTLNLTAYSTNIDDYQTNVQSPQLGVNRGYIANAEQVRVQGTELDINYKPSSQFTLYTAISFTDGKYIKFTNAPLPLEETGKTVDGVQVAFKDISGQRLPGISKWAGSLGAEYSIPTTIYNKQGKFFIGADGYYRSEFSSSPTPSQYLNIDGYTLVNARLGFRTVGGVSLSIWSRNIFNKNYYEQLLVAGGNAGQYAGVLGDPRTYGLTIRYVF